MGIGCGGGAGSKGNLPGGGSALPFEDKLQSFRPRCLPFWPVHMILKFMEHHRNTYLLWYSSGPESPQGRQNNVPVGSPMSGGVKWYLALHSVGLYWVPGHVGVRGNETADGLARSGSASGFVGPEPALGVWPNKGNSLFYMRFVYLMDLYLLDLWTHCPSFIWAYFYNPFCSKQIHMFQVVKFRNLIRKFKTMRAYVDTVRYACVICVSTWLKKIFNISLRFSHKFLF
jgi:hypothetical protein